MMGTRDIAATKSAALASVAALRGPEGASVQPPIPKPLKRLFYELDWLAQMRAGQKINTQRRSFVSSDSRWQLLRGLFGESRERTLGELETLVSEIVPAMQEYATSSFLPLLLAKLAAARTSLGALRDTYAGDPNFLARLQGVFDDIDLQLNQHRAGPAHQARAARSGPASQPVIVLENYTPAAARTALSTREAQGSAAQSAQPAAASTPIPEPPNEDLLGLEYT